MRWVKSGMYEGPLWVICGNRMAPCLYRLLPRNRISQHARPTSEMSESSLKLIKGPLALDWSNVGFIAAAWCW